MPYFNWNEHQLYYRQQGKGPLLLVLPGNTASSGCHQGELDYFSDRFCVISIDFYGTGKSDRAAVWSENWWAEGADQAKSLVDYLGYDECIVMGTSGGAVSALLMAIKYPKMVKAVIADSCVEQFAKDEVYKSVVLDRNQRTSGQVGFWKFVHGEDWEKIIESDTAMLLQFAEDGGDWFLGRLNEIACPVLITASKQDKDLPQVETQVVRMSDQIANCRVFFNSSGGHPLMWSAPQDFRSVSNYFLRTLIKV